MRETEFISGDVVVYTSCDKSRCVCTPEDNGAIGIIQGLEHPTSPDCLYVHWISWPCERPTEGPWPRHLRKLEVPSGRD